MGKHILLYTGKYIKYMLTIKSLVTPVYKRPLTFTAKAYLKWIMCCGCCGIIVSGIRSVLDAAVDTFGVDVFVMIGAILKCCRQTKNEIELVSIVMIPYLKMHALVW